MAAKNIVSTDMKLIREIRDVHVTEEQNAFIAMSELKTEQRDASNRGGGMSLENERSFNTKASNKKDESAAKEKEKKKEFEEVQTKMLAPPSPIPGEPIIEEVEEDLAKPPISDEEWKRRVMEDIVESFKLIDIDGDGKISIFEIISIMGSVGDELSEDDAEDIMEFFDMDGDGEISFEEFKECMYEKMNQETVDTDLQEAFNIFDSDGDGFISPQEVQYLFKKLGDLISTDEAMEMMKDCDINQDGLIDFEEFKAFYLKVFEGKPTLTEELVLQQLAEETQELERSEEARQMAEFPQASVPSQTDYK